MWFRRRIFMDYAGGTPCSPRATKAMRAAAQIAGNPGALHAEGERARLSLEASRIAVARMLEVRPATVFFTSGATEGNNLVVNGVRRHTGGHIVVAAIEHQSVLAPVRKLEKEGYEVTHLAPHTDGRIRADALQKALRPDTRLVSIGWANGETGIVQPLHKLVQVVREYEKETGAQIVVHTDAGQAPLYLPSIVAGLGVDVLTLDSGKLYGPRGVGALYLRAQDMAQPLFLGGGQEKGLRPGTENVALAAGFAAACSEAQQGYKKEAARMQDLRADFCTAVQAAIPDVRINDHPGHQLPHIVNISIPGIDPEYVVLRMDALGVAVSTKSACEEKARESHVLAAYVKEEEAWRAKTTVRISFGRGTHARDIAPVAKALQEAAELSRKFAESQK